MGDCNLENCMANKIGSFSIENKDVIFIKPSKPTPTTILSLSSIDNSPENNFYTQSLYVYRSANHKTKLDPANVIKEAISKALFYYYPLAGKIVRHVDGKLRVNCNGDGVPFIEAICNCDLSSLHYFDASDLDMAKNFGVNFPFQDESGNQYPCIYKVTKFSCGGFIIVMCGSHVVFDGSGASQFLRAVAELASGNTEPSVKPVWERERLVGKITTQPLQNLMGNDCVAVSPLLPSANFSHQCLKVDSESITRLKTSLMINNEEISKMKGFTTFESLSAYIWRSRARALKLNENGKTMLCILVGIKPHMLNPLPEGYYGNSIVEAFTVLTVKELNERPLWEVVKLIRESIKVVLTNDYITQSIDSMETKPVKYNWESGAITTVTDWRNLGLLAKVDFGWKEAVNTLPVPCDLFGATGLCTILPPSKLDPSMNLGAKVFVSLPPAAMPKFKEEMEALGTSQDKLDTSINLEAKDDVSLPPAAMPKFKEEMEALGTSQDKLDTSINLEAKNDVSLPPAAMPKFKEEVEALGSTSQDKLDPSMNLGAKVCVSLPPAAMPKFKEEMEALVTSQDKLDPSMNLGAKVCVSLPPAAMPKLKEEMEAIGTSQQ
ncbi:hypothetical protein VNO77_05260 [Canavalia gladiata]|uniref:Uncharacterized protein n=1 Tax=Canavalia gladiata TaxID=3824 RepID=A0AAN9MY09_CANGL